MSKQIINQLWHFIIHPCVNCKRYLPVEVSHRSCQKFGWYVNHYGLTRVLSHCSRLKVSRKELGTTLKYTGADFQANKQRHSNHRTLTGILSRDFPVKASDWTLGWFPWVVLRCWHVRYERLWRQNALRRYAYCLCLLSIIVHYPASSTSRK